MHTNAPFPDVAPFTLGELAERLGSAHEYLEFLRVPDLNAGLYRLIPTSEYARTSMIRGVE